MGFLRFIVDSFSRLLGYANLAANVVLIARFGLQFSHPPKWDGLAPIIQLRAWLDPQLVAIGEWSGLKWAPDHRGFLPLILAVVVIVAYNVVVNLLENLSDRLAPKPAPLPQGPVLANVATLPGVAVSTAGGATMAPPPATSTQSAVMSTQFAPRGASMDATAVPPAHDAATVIQSVPPAVSAARSGKPDQIGRYEVLSKLGQGAMGIVYKARDTQIGRIVAIKSILAADMSDPAVEQYKLRFLQEAQSAGQLNHPGIVTVYDITHDAANQPCLVMEFIEGTTLDKATQGERFAMNRVLEVMIEVSQALAHAHNHGIVHRDIKPANILITKDGRAKVSDFGIAKMAGSNLTMTGQIIGTPGFMSPEQFTGGHIDARSDIFSLGGVLYWMCTGERPFPGDTVTAIAYKVVNSAPLSARQVNPAVPESLERIIFRCLEKDPNSRYPDALTLADDLAAVRKGAFGEMTQAGVSAAPPG